MRLDKVVRQLIVAAGGYRSYLWLTVRLKCKIKMQANSTCSANWLQNHKYMQNFNKLQT